MRWVSIRNGLMQRIPEIIGNDNTTSFVLNDWSVQAAMIENLKRIVKSINKGSTDGTVAYGLDITMSGLTATISTGIGLTPFGRLIKTNVAAQKTMPSTYDGGKVYVYIMYGETDSVINAKSTPILNSTAVNISKDEICAGTTDVDDTSGQIEGVVTTKKTLIEYNPASTPNTTDGVLLATLTSFASGSIWKIEKNTLSNLTSETTYLEGTVLDLDVLGINTLICSATTTLDIGGFSGGIPYQVLHIMNIGAGDVVLNDSIGSATQKIYFDGTTLTLASAGSHYKGVTLMCSPSGAWGVIGTTGVIA